MYQHRSYVTALENAPDLNGMYVDQAQDGMSFRNYNGLCCSGAEGTAPEKREATGRS